MDYQVKIISPDDCGNAPKKQLLREWIIAIANKDRELLAHYTSKNAEWKVVNDTVVQGKDNVLQAWEDSVMSRVIQIELFQIITHGKTAAMNGQITFEDNRLYDFCHVFEFVSAGKNTIKSVTSYVIKNQ